MIIIDPNGVTYDERHWLITIVLGPRSALGYRAPTHFKIGHRPWLSCEDAKGWAIVCDPADTESFRAEPANIDLIGLFPYDVPWDKRVLLPFLDAARIELLMLYGVSGGRA